MKKIKLLITLFICVFIFPVVVRADMGAPDITSYKVIVQDTDGIDMVDFNGKKIASIPYDTELEVKYEAMLEDKNYGSVEYDGENGFIDLENVKVSSSYNLKDAEKLDQSKDLYVFRKGCYLYNGPSVTYGKVEGLSEVPVGTVLTYKYYDSAWSMVEYKGKKGWILNYPYFPLYKNIDTSVAEIAPEGSKVFMFEGAKNLFVEPSNESKKIDVNISVGEEIKFKYVYNQAKSEYIYVEYEDVEGWLYIQSSSFGFDSSGGAIKSSCKSVMIIDDELPLYSDFDLSSKTKKTVKSGDEYQVIYDFVYNSKQWYQIEYEGKKYWLSVDVSDMMDDDYEESIVSNYGYNTSYKALKDITIYSSYKNEEKVGTISKGDKFNTIYFYYYNDDSYEYVDIDGVKGWISTDDAEYVDNEVVCRDIANNALIEEEEEKKEEEKKEKEEKRDRKKSSSSNQSLDPKTIALIAVGGALILALVVIVIIKIANKKKNKKKNSEVFVEEKKEESKEENKDESKETIEEEKNEK